MPTEIPYDRVADLYDRYVTADYDVDFFLREAGHAGGPVLELMCGTGRLSLPLIEAGVPWTGVDASPKMLAVLTEKLEARGLRGDVHCMDVRALDLPGPFALVLLPFQSFMEITDPADQRAVLDAVYAHLEPGGRFICTLHNPPVRRATVDGLFRLVGVVEDDRGVLVVSGVERGGTPVVTRLQFFEQFAPDGTLLWKRVLPMSFAFVEHDAFADMTRRAGFRVDALYGDYDRTPFAPSDSPAMIWVLRRG
jgi:SAM-dependent methyltransferase